MIEQVKPGDPIRASQWNELVKAVRPTAPRPLPTPTGAQAGVSYALDLLVLNDTGGDLTDEFPILRLDVPVYTISDNAQAPYNGVSFKAKAPDGVTSGNFVVMQGKCPTGQMRPAVVQGATWCKVNVTDAGHGYAVAASGDTAKAVSDAATGARILWKESGTGTKWAVVLIGGGGSSGSTLQWGVVTTEISAATNWSAIGAGAVQFKTVGGADDGAPITVNNWFPLVYEAGWIVCCDRRFDPPLVVTGSCVPA